MILMLTKHPSYSFSCLIPYICVFFRNKENEAKSKQFGQEMKNPYKEEAMVATKALMVTTTRQNQEVTTQPTLGVVATTKPVFSQLLV